MELYQYTYQISSNDYFDGNVYTTMEEATKEFFSKHSNIPTITLEDIEDLLRREVPKDPIKISDQYMYHFQCPTCHNESIYATKNKRCMHCGQVLDWKSYEDDK